jgi:hypothetical protein
MANLAITDRILMFSFRVPHIQPVAAESAGVDLNMPSADFATSDGVLDSVDLIEITRVQGAMARKRDKIRWSIPTDQKAQDRVFGRYRNRERDRLTPLLHRAAHELLAKVGSRNIIFENLTETTEELLKDKKKWEGEGILRRRVESSPSGRTDDSNGLSATNPTALSCG